MRMTVVGSTMPAGGSVLSVKILKDNGFLNNCDILIPCWPGEPEHHGEEICRVVDQSGRLSSGAVVLFGLCPGA
ncbi:MAG: hypothetical protein LZF62_430184 [Nitrospira sp.]|nr:MAG: hypothetical protein LZF62_430184 [Nitrospira sp.]